VEILTNPETWVALLTLTALEIVLGIDNIVFISIVAGKLPEGQRDFVRRVGIVAAMAMRIGLLLVLSWVIGLTAPLFEIGGHPFSGRDLILIGGGLFLLAKATWEIHGRLEGDDHQRDAGRVSSVTGAIIQIMVLDIIFSLDSVITAVGMVNEIPVMIAAIVIAVLVMLVSSGYIIRILDQHPSLKILALAFLLLIGVTLVAEGFGQHIDKAYIYFAMAFAVFVEAINIRATRRSEPVALHDPYHEKEAPGAAATTQRPSDDDATPGPAPA
jgi:predicted tellurium resistance membrane protein TerC